MFNEYAVPGYQQPVIVRQSSPPVYSGRPLTPILPTRVSVVNTNLPTPQIWQNEVKQPLSIQSTIYGSSNSIPAVVVPTYPRSQEIFQEPVLPSTMTQSLNLIPTPQAPSSPMAGNRIRPLTNSSSRIVPYLQVREPQPQYPDFTVDQGAKWTIPEFAIKSPTETNSQSLMNLQVIYTDSSDQEFSIKKLFESQYVFVDGAFPHDYYQLFGNMDRRDPSYQQRARMMIWRRFSEIVPNPTIYGSGISPNNILQGGFGTCYFLVGLSALAERPQRIRDLFIWDEVNDHKVFVCTLLFRGRWKTIYLDEFFPLPRNEYLVKGARGCAMGPKGQMWVSLLEKAWAKLYGSYYTIEGGYTEEGLHDLTGAHITFVRTRSIEFNADENWKTLIKATNAGYSIVAESSFGKDTDISQAGMVFGHAYTVLGVYEIAIFGGKPTRLVKCRNPWGQQEWALDWSDTDPRWKAVSPQDISRIGFSPNIKDGVFFMEYQDFYEWMTKITIAEIIDGSSYVYCTQQEYQGNGKYFKIKIFKEGWYSFQLNQTPDKFLEEGQRNDFEYKTATLNIGQILPGGDIKYYKGAQCNQRTIFRKHDLLPPGDYIVFAQQGFHRSDPYRDVTLAISGQFYCEISPAEEILAYDYHRKLLLSKGRSEATQISKDIYYIQEVLLEDGFLYFAVYNRSNRAVTIRTKAFQNLNKEIPPAQELDRKLAAGEEFIMFERIRTYGIWTSSLCGVQIIE